MVAEMSGRGNVLVGKCSVGELSVRGNVHRGSVCRGSVTRGSVLGEVSVGEMSVYQFFRSREQGSCFSACCHELDVNFILICKSFQVYFLIILFFISFKLGKYTCIFCNAMSAKIFQDVCFVIQLVTSSIALTWCVLLIFLKRIRVNAAILVPEKNLLRTKLSSCQRNSPYCVHSYKTYSTYCFHSYITYRTTTQ